MKRFSSLCGIVLAGVCISFLGVVGVANAAKITIEAPAQSFGVGDSFVIPVTLDTVGSNVNALEGALSYTSDVLTLREIRDGNSILNFWVERPLDLDGSVRFAGITPGGYTGSTGLIFTLVFEAKHAGSARFALTDAQALLNDGAGTKTTITLRAAPIIIAETGSGTKAESLIESDDIAPEEFSPTLGSDANIFGGEHFVAFATQDKQSGVDRYEVTESRGFQWFGLRPRTWRNATSPHLLSDQEFHSYIYVRAYDRAGNERTEVLSPERVPYNVGDAAVLAIMLVFLLVSCGWFGYAGYFKKSST